MMTFLLQRNRGKSDWVYEPWTKTLCLGGFDITITSWTNHFILSEMEGYPLSAGIDNKTNGGRTGDIDMEINEILETGQDAEFKEPRKDDVLNTRTYKCPICEINFTDFDEYIADNRRHNGGKEFRCHYCDHIETKVYKFKEHVRGHTGDKPYICPTCGAGFKGHTPLWVHRQLHGTREYVCQYCQKTFKRKPPLDWHVNKVHLGITAERKYKCTECDKAYTSRHNLKEHSWSHIEDKPYKCGSCEKSFGSSRRLQDHLHVHSGVKPYTCTICGWVSKRASHLKVHVRTHTGEEHKCPACDKTYKRMSSLNVHIRRDHGGERPHKCDQCPQEFWANQDLKFHMAVAHAGEWSLRCETCGKAFQKRHMLLDHERTHSGEKPFYCDVCQQSFHSRKNLRQHLLAHRVAAGEKRERCPRCDKEFAASYLRKHRKYCGRQTRSPRCRVCQKCLSDDARPSCTFNCKVCLVELPCSSFREHAMSHVSEDTTQCAACDKILPDVLKLKKHIWYCHSEAETWNCVVCDRVFTNKGSLRLHLAKHRGDTTHQCNVCQKSFVNSSRLKAHEVIHTGVRSFQCHLCHKTFTQKGNLKTHLKVHDRQSQTSTVSSSAAFVKTELTGDIEESLGTSGDSATAAAYLHKQPTDDFPESPQKNPNNLMIWWPVQTVLFISKLNL